MICATHMMILYRFHGVFKAIMWDRLSLDRWIRMSEIESALLVEMRRRGYAQ
jgi:hypothetical protein